MSTIDKIFYLLEEKGYKQKDLTDYLGINKSVATQWRRGTSDSYTKYLTKIADFLGVKGGDLIEDVEYDELVISSLDDETREIIDILRKRPEMKTLFKVARDATKEDIEDASNIIEKFKKGSGSID